MEELLFQLISEVKKANDELEWIEFKTNIGDMKSSITYDGVGNYISAMSNAACWKNKEFAYLVLGIENKTWNIVGTNLKMPGRYKNQNFEFWLRTQISPKIYFRIEEFEIDGKHIVILVIPAAKGEATLFNGIAKIRIGSSITSLNNYPEIHRIIINSQDDWSFHIVESATINDLDNDALIKVREKFKEVSTNRSFFKEIDQWSMEQVLDKAGITVNGKITRTALILLGKQESAHLLSPYVAQMTWKLSGDRLAYEHFGMPFILNTTKLYQKIRNYPYKFFPKDELLATTVDRYDSAVILESLHNAIAHQDYTLQSKIVLTEKEDSIVIENSGNFFDGKPEDYFDGSITPRMYRNKFLADAMANIGMIDSVGFGISKMVKSQKERFFPLPDYMKSKYDEVRLEIFAKVIDDNYCKLLIDKRIDLQDAILLDRVQKGTTLSIDQFNYLKKKQLVEGRYPSIRITSKLINTPKEAVKYLRAKGFDMEEMKSGIIKILALKEGAIKENFIEYLLPRMSSLKTDEQNKKIITNTLQIMKAEGTIYPKGKKWYLVKK